MTEYRPAEEQPQPPKHLSARVPDSVANGVFATGVVVMGTPGELVLDFLQTLVHPNQMVARVVLPWHTIPSLVQAMRQNLVNHKTRYGDGGDESEQEEHSETVEPPESPDEVESGERLESGASAAPEKASRPVEPAKFYDELKYAEDVFVGPYANGAMINHTEFEFKIDFICSVQPYPVVVSRVFLSKPQFQRVLRSLEEHDSKRRGGP